MQNSRNFRGVVAGFGVLVAAAANAATLYNGWMYAIDDATDGSGGASYEYRGLAYRIVDNDIVFAISTGMALGGVADGKALNGGIANGDLFLNFSGHALNSAAAFEDKLVFAVRFDAANDSLGNVGGSNVQTGLYGAIKVASLTTQNRGWAKLQDYLNGGFGRGAAAMGDLNDSIADVVPYLGNGKQYPNIAEGVQLGTIALKSRSDLAALGLDFGHFGADPGGNRVYGFAVDGRLLPTGDFLAHLSPECSNDGVAIYGSNAVPEPSTVAAILMGLATLAKRRKRANG